MATINKSARCALGATCLDKRGGNARQRHMSAMIREKLICPCQKPFCCQRCLQKHQTACQLAPGPSLDPVDRQAGLQQQQAQQQWQRGGAGGGAAEAAVANQGSPAATSTTSSNGSGTTSIPELMASIGLSLAPPGAEPSSALFSHGSGTCSLKLFARCYELGRGMCGPVFAARRLSDSMPVALKVLDAREPDSREVKARAGTRELQLLLALRGVEDKDVKRLFMQLLDCFIIEPAASPAAWPLQACLVLQRGECDLVKWAAANRSGCPPVLPLALMRFALRGMLQPLHVMHTTFGIVHRDIKPSNFILMFDGSITIADFGMATTIKDCIAGATSMQRGTLDYLVPELKEKRALFGASRPDTATDHDRSVRDYVVATPTIVDIFALGLSAVAIYTGTNKPVHGWAASNTEAPLPACMSDEGLCSFVRLALSAHADVTALKLLQHSFLQP